MTGELADWVARRATWVVREAIEWADMVHQQVAATVLIIVFTIVLFRVIIIVVRLATGPH